MEQAGKKAKEPGTGITRLSGDEQMTRVGPCMRIAAAADWHGMQDPPEP